jgi:hypothetical protein
LGVGVGEVLGLGLLDDGAGLLEAGEELVGVADVEKLLGRTVEEGEWPLPTSQSLRYSASASGKLSLSVSVLVEGS